MSRPPSLGVPGSKMSPHVSAGTVTCPPPAGGSFRGLRGGLKYLSPPGVLLPRDYTVYGTSTSLLWLELRGPAARQATPSWAVCRLACNQLIQQLQLTFAMVPDAAWLGSDRWPWRTAPATGPISRLGSPSSSDPWGVIYLYPVPLLPWVCTRICCLLCVLCCVCVVVGLFAPVHRCARSVCSVAGAVSLAKCLLFTGTHPRCAVCAVSLATCLLFTGVPAWCVELRVRCPWPLGPCSSVCRVGVLRSLCPCRLDSWSPVCPLGVFCCVCGVLGHFASVHRCARWVACVVSLGT